MGAANPQASIPDHPCRRPAAAGGLLDAQDKGRELDAADFEIQAGAAGPFRPARRKPP